MTQGRPAVRHDGRPLRRPGLWLAAALGACLVAPAAAQRPPAPAAGRGTAAPVDRALFVPTRVATVELTFAADQYAALEPRRVGPIRRLPGQSWLLGPEGGHNGFAAVAGIEFAYVHADVVIDGRAFTDAGVRYKGNGTFVEGRDKPSYKIDLNRYVKGQTLGPLGTLNLHNGTTDPSLMNEVVAFRLYRDAGVGAPRTSYARVFLTVRGRSARRFAGLYSLVENTDAAFLAARGQPVAGAAIFKPVIPSLFTDFGSDWRAYNQSYDPKTDLTESEKARVIQFSRIVTHGSDGDFARAAPEYLDLDAVARYLAVAVLVSDMDGMVGTGQNYYMHLDPRTNRFSFSAWDQDRSFGNYHRGSMRDWVRLDVRRPFGRENRFLDRLFALPAFRSRYLAHLADFQTRLFVPVRLAAQVDELAQAIRPAVAEESAAKLASFDRAVAGRREPSIKAFVPARAASVASQLTH